MAVTNPEYDIDLSGLSHLLQNVIAYVEVRSDFDDISNEIAREMRQMGACISDKRNNKVTHVIFRDGTFRTSNWAKKHNIPLVGVGWLAACARSKMELLCAPWREDYLKEIIDEYGVKKRTRYKKYCKWMDKDEFEADLNRSVERSLKRLDKSHNKSINKSKSNNGFETDNNEYNEIIKLSDPCLPPRPPTPEFVKKHFRRHERLRLGGRYSWESSDDEKETSSNEESEKSQNNALAVDENVLPNHISKMNIDHYIGSPKNRTCLNGERRLFKDDYNVPIELIEPIGKRHKRKVVSRVIPKAVLMKEETTTNVRKRKHLACIDDYPLSKRKKMKDLSLDTPDITSIINLSVFNSPVPIKIPTKKTAIPIDKIPLSPLVTNKASAISTPQTNFATPINKRSSLRTRLLKKSTKKLLRDSLYGSDDNTNESDTELQAVLVPETDMKERRRPEFTKFVPCSPSELYVVPETPARVILDISLNNPSSSSENPTNCSMTSSIVGNIFDTPNASRVLNEIIPNRVKSQSNQNILFIAKDTYNHYSTAITPIFKEQIKYISQKIPKMIVPNTDDIISSPTKKPQINRTNVRRSIRLSKLPELSAVDDMDIFNPDDEKNVKTTDAEEILEKKSNTRPSIDSQQLEKPLLEKRSNLKRAWTEANPVKVLKTTLKVKKQIQKAKKFRDSTDDFVFTSPKMTKKVSRSSLSSADNEIILVGLDHDELMSITSSCAKLTGKYSCVDIIRTKEQIVVVPDKPKKNIDLIKAFIYGNIFVSLSWVLDSISSKKWLDHNRYQVPCTELMQSPLQWSSHNALLFSEYSAMYISTNAHTMPKYKLRLLIEQCGGTVTDSFRQAGIVIGTRKVNALSVSAAWILDSVKEGRVVDDCHYRIT